MAADDKLIDLQLKSIDKAKVTGIPLGAIPFGLDVGLEGADAKLFFDPDNGRLGIGTATPAVTLEVKGTDGEVRVNNSGSANTNYISIIDGDAANAEIQIVRTTGTAQLKIDPIPKDGISNANIRFFRDTSTTGTRQIQIFEGDGGTQLNTVIEGNGSAFFAANGGGVAIGASGNADFTILDLVSTTGAFLLPRMTTTQRDALDPINGMEIYNSTLNKFQGYENGTWTSFI